MSDVEIKLSLPEELVREARDLNILSDSKIAELIQAEMDRQLSRLARQQAIGRQLEEMASDPDIQRELRAIDREFSDADFDGLSETD